VLIRQRIQSVLCRFGYRLSRIEESNRFPRLDLLDLLVAARVHDNSEFFFVQIGASDGIAGDPLHPLIARYGLKGLSVEPQPMVFEQLRNNRSIYPGQIFENAIVGETDGVATLYLPVGGTEIPYSLKQAASLERAQLSAILDRYSAALGKSPESEILITPVQLPSLTLVTLFSKHHITSVDLLILDTMGFDFRIIKQIPFASIAPSLIQFEHRLLPRDERTACFKLLADNGYCFCHVDMDTIAVRNGLVRFPDTDPADKMPAIKQYLQ
jgi:FkbM family methyltransferase